MRRADLVSRLGSCATEEQTPDAAISCNTTFTHRSGGTGTACNDTRGALPSSCYGAEAVQCGRCILVLTAQENSPQDFTARLVVTLDHYAQRMQSCEVSTRNCFYEPRLRPYAEGSRPVTIVAPSDGPSKHHSLPLDSMSTQSSTCSICRTHLSHRSAINVSVRQHYTSRKSAPMVYESTKRRIPGAS